MVLQTMMMSCTIISFSYSVHNHHFVLIKLSTIGKSSAAMQSLWISNCVL